MKPILTLIALTLLAFAGGCDLLSPKKDVSVSFQDTTVTAPNGSVIFYGTVTQAPLDSATLARLRREGYAGNTDKAPVANADVFAINGDTIKTVTDSRGRFALALKSGRFTVHIGNYSTSSLDTTLTIDANKELNVILTPMKEFIFPLAIGNKWVYDYAGFNQTITGIWEITRKQPLVEGTIFTVSMDNSPDNTTNHYQHDTSIVALAKYFILPGQLILNAPQDTVPRFIPDGVDTIKLIRGSFPSTTIRYYVHRVGLVYYYTISGSPGSGYKSATLKLRSYTLKP